MSVESHTAKLISGIALLTASVVFFTMVFPYVSTEFLENQLDDYLYYYDNNALLVVAVYLLISAILIGAALPVAGIFTLLAGALFGFQIGWAVSVAGSTIGATLVFLWSRYLFRDWLQDRFEEQFAIVNKNIDDEGFYYLFSIRLLMIFPFFLINLLSGLTRLKFSTYLLATIIGQIIVLAPWSFAGSTMANFAIDAEVLTLETFIILAMVGLAPLLIHRFLNRLKSRG